LECFQTRVSGRLSRGYIKDGINKRPSTIKSITLVVKEKWAATGTAKASTKEKPSQLFVQ